MFAFSSSKPFLRLQKCFSIERNSVRSFIFRKTLLITGGVKVAELFIKLIQFINPDFFLEVLYIFQIYQEMALIFPKRKTSWKFE